MDINPIQEPQSKEAQNSYDRIVNSIQKLYDDSLSDREAHEAARNLIGFCKLLLEIQLQRLQNHGQEQ